MAYKTEILPRSACCKICLRLRLTGNCQFGKICNIYKISLSFSIEYDNDLGAVDKKLMIHVLEGHKNIAEKCIEETLKKFLFPGTQYEVV